MYKYIWGFRARQHLRSLGPVMSDYGRWWWPNDIRGPWGLKLPHICLTDEEKPRKNLTQETCPDRGSNPGPLCDRRACYHLSHIGGLLNFYFPIQCYRASQRVVCHPRGPAEMVAEWPNLGFVDSLSPSRLTVHKCLILKKNAHNTILCYNEYSMVVKFGLSP